MERAVVVVCSTDPLTVPGIVSYLRERPDVQVVPVHRVAEARVVVIATESVTPEVISMLEHVSALSDALVVLVTNEITDADVRTAVRCGVVSVLARSSLTGDKLVNAVANANRQTARPPADVVNRLLGQLDRVDRGVLRPRGAAETVVQRRELDLLRLLAEGYDTKEIAVRLAYSERTVKNIVQGLLNRWNVKNRTHVVAHAMRTGVL